MTERCACGRPLRLLGVLWELSSAAFVSNTSRPMMLRGFYTVISETVERTDVCYVRKTSIA